MFWAILLLMAGFVAFPEAVLSAAADGALTWWTRVVPALTPYLILTGLACKANPNGLKIGKLHPYATGSLLLGALGGYPVGARVLEQGLHSGALTPKQAQQFSYASGLMSPAFLISVTALGLFKSRGAILPLCGSVYGVTLLVFLLFSLRKGDSSPLVRQRLSADDVTEAISDGMQAILRIGGCILLCRCLGALLSCCSVSRLIARLLPVSEDTVSAMLAGLLEMTGGCTMAAALPIPFAWRLALCVFFQMFGGASVLLQVRSFLKIPSFGRYVLMRFCMAIASALLCLLLCRLIPDQPVEAIASADELLHRAQTLLGLAIPCGVGLLSAVIFVIMTRPVPKSRILDDKRTKMC